MGINPPERQVRALYNERTVRIYQAYTREIAVGALEAQTFRPPFKLSRMTWIKPSFTWMMYRSGWGRKMDQEIILGINIIRSGFEWALAHSSISHYETGVHASPEQWRKLLRAAPVRIQWDPERTLSLEALPWRTIQIGLSGQAVNAYINEWITSVEDMTPLAQRIEGLVAERKMALAEKMQPVEKPYPLTMEISCHIGCNV